MRTGTQGLLEGVPLPWGPDDTEAYLSAWPLPSTMRWQGRAVVPTYRISKGYGFWLRTTPYHPGLFEALNRYLARCEVLPSPEQMQEAMQEVEAGNRPGAQGELFAGDGAA